MKAWVIRAMVMISAIILVSATFGGCTTDSAEQLGMALNPVDGDADGYSPLAAVSAARNNCQDPNNWASCRKCKDRDGDGYSSHRKCGVVQDCDDKDPDNWVSCDTCDDLDGDLVFAGCDDYTQVPGPDCDDADFLVYPGAPEACDGLDNQCPGDLGFGEVDEGCAPPCTDEDEDGFCAEADYGPDQDCVDTDYWTNPGVYDIPCDYTDSDCDGMDFDQASCICTMEYNPVCGINGITYSNECMSMCAGCVPIDCYGECPCGGDIPFCDPFAYCITLWDPVCGMDGVTYGNDCEALNWGCTEIACRGMCPCW